MTENYTVAFIRHFLFTAIFVCICLYIQVYLRGEYPKITQRHNLLTLFCSKLPHPICLLSVICVFANVTSQCRIGRCDSIITAICETITNCQQHQRRLINHEISATISQFR
jgi:hypothetical protein